MINEILYFANIVNINYMQQEEFFVFLEILSDCREYLSLISKKEQGFRL